MAELAQQMHKLERCGRRWNKRRCAIRNYKSDSELETLRHELLGAGTKSEAQLRRNPAKCEPIDVQSEPRSIGSLPALSTSTQTLSQN